MWEAMPMVKAGSKWWGWMDLKGGRWKGSVCQGRRRGLAVVASSETEVVREGSVAVEWRVMVRY